MVTPLSGDPALASDIVIPYWRNKTIAETVTNSAVLQNDDDFGFTLPVGTWSVTLWLHAFLTAGVAADIKTAWTNTGTMTVIARSCLGPAVGSASVDDGNVRSTGHNLGTSVPYGLDAATTGVIREELLITVTVAGTLQLQWAQNTATVGVGTTCSVGSRVIVNEVEALP